MGTFRITFAMIATAVMAGCGAATVVDGAAIERVIAARPVTVEVPSSPEPTATPEASLSATSTPRDPRLELPMRKRPFARVGSVRLFHPADEVRAVGFHQASDLKSRAMIASKLARLGRLLGSRGRGTPRRSAADIAVDPRAEIFAPVSGIVKRAGDYRLYCKHQDAFVIISPHGHPEIEVKILHVSGRRVRAGDRVVAGETMIAKRSTLFPFPSQIDRFTPGRRGPHVHIEVTQLAVPSAVPQPGTGLAFGC